MTPAELGALVAAAVAFLAALTSYIHSAQARRAVQMHLQLHHRKAVPTVRRTEGNGVNEQHR